MATSTYMTETAKVHVLDNGLTVALERLPYLHSASAGVWIKTGSAHETPPESGLAHFLEHLFFKGTQTRTVRQIMEAVEGRGGHLNAFTSRECTCLYVRTLDEHLHKGIEILADILKHSTFHDLEKERNVILEEIASVEDTPDEHVHDLLSAFHWPDHPLGRSVSGSQETVSKLSLEDAQHFYSKWYKPENIVVSVAGNFDETRLLDQLRAEFGTLAPGAASEADSVPRFNGGIKTYERDIGQAHLSLAFPGPALDDPKRYVCDVACNLLGGGSTSRLFERIREAEGLAYSIFAFHSFYRTAGMLGVYAAIAPQNFGKTLELTFQELRRIRDEAVGADELAMNREQIKGGMLMSLENTFTRMARMAKSLMYYGRIVPVQEVIGRIEAVTQEDTQAFAQEIFTEKNCALVVLGPADGYTVDGIDL